jgi:cell division transport system permease protein
MNILKYYVRDAREGIARNLGAALAAAALVFISMVLLGSLLLLRSGLVSVMSYMQSQIGLKVYVDSGIDVQDIASIMKSKDFVKTASVETREQLLVSLSGFFQGREHLLQTFKDSDLPNAVRLELVDYGLAEQAAEQLRRIPGITEVIYPQKLALQVIYWSNQMNKFGVILLLFFVVIAFLTVFLAVKLAVYQRLKEIRVKLLLGARPWHVRGQFMFEGLLIGFIGSTMAVMALYAMSEYMFAALEGQFPFVFHFRPTSLNEMMFCMLLSGSFIALLASYISTGRTIKHV